MLLDERTGDDFDDERPECLYTREDCQVKDETPGIRLNRSEDPI